MNQAGDGFEDKAKPDINKKAVALNYVPGAGAPRVVAKGAGFVAQQILEHGELNQIPVYRDDKLVEELIGVELGLDIPPELYEVVARVLIFVGDLDKLRSITG